MSKRYIIIGGIVIGIVIVFILLIYVIVNSGFFRFNSNSTNTTTTSISSEQNNERNLDYSYVRQSIPNNLQSKLPESKNGNVIDYYYSKDLSIAFSYELVSLVDKDKFIALTPPENGGTVNTIYLHHLNEAKESGQSIEIIDIEDKFRLNTIPEIINSQILDDKQKQVCKIEEKNNRYAILSKDTKVTDSTTICGKYAKGNNKFFIKPIQDSALTKKLLFVNAGDKEWSYDGTMQGKYWYESIIAE